MTPADYAERFLVAVFPDDPKRRARYSLALTADFAACDRDALERAAKVADDRGEKMQNYCAFCLGAERACEYVAEEIRALAPEGTA